MTCPECEEHCSLDNPCTCECHDPEEEKVIQVLEPQTIEYEEDEHLPDGMVLKKIRIVVTGPSTQSAYNQFERVHAKVKA